MPKTFSFEKIASTSILCVNNNNMVFIYSSIGTSVHIIEKYLIVIRNGLHMLMTQKRDTRRGIMKKATVGGLSLLSATTIPVVGATAPDRHEVHEQARQIVERTGSVEKRERYLRKHDIPVFSTQTEYTVRRPQKNDGVSTQYLDENDLRIYLAFSEINYGKWDAFIQWQWGKQDLDDWGEAPRDQIGLVWDDSHYFFDNDEVFSDKLTDYNSAQIVGSQGGIGWSFNDVDGDSAEPFFGEVYLRYGVSSVPGRRQVKGEYVHTYQGEIDGINVGFPSGVTVKWNDNGESWQTSQQPTDGDPLIVSPQAPTA
jgi:hypothetical protein